MYVIRDKKTKELLHVAHSAPGEELDPKEIYPEWNPKTMEVGHTDATAIPAWFTIEKGEVKEADPPRREPEPAAGEPPFAQVKAATTEALTRQALQARQQLIPDYKLLNAGLGVYDDAEVAAIRATVNAFRDEVKRLEAAIAKARSPRDLRGLKAHFPTAMVKPPKDAVAAAPSARDAADEPAPAKPARGRKTKK